MRQHGWSLSAFKSYYPLDQLSYLAIAVNWAHGLTAGIAPFTETGHSYYPGLYHEFMDVVARIFRLAPTATWNLLAFVVQLAFISGLGWLIARLTRTSWGALMALVPITAGTFGRRLVPNRWAWSALGALRHDRRKQRRGGGADARVPVSHVPAPSRCDNRRLVNCRGTGSCWPAARLE